MKSIEVIISISNGVPYFPPQIPSILYIDKEYPYSRIGNIVSLVKQEGLSNKYNLTKINSEFLGSIPKDEIYTLSGPYSNDFFYVRNELNSSSFRICKVLTSLPWTIVCEKSGKERIKYFSRAENYKIIDKELNYAVPK